MSLFLTGCATSTAVPAAEPVGGFGADVAAERVLVLPVQGVAAVGDRDRLSAELVFALRERDTRVVWVAPDELRRALRRAPGYAASPDSLPRDPLVHHGERRAGDALIGELRRFGALVDARMVLVPRIAQQDGRATPQRFFAGLVDSRTGSVVAWADVVMSGAESLHGAELSEWAAAVARRLVPVAAGGSR